MRALREVHEADGYPAWWPADPSGWLAPAGWAAAWIAERAGSVVGHVCVVRGVLHPVVTALTEAAPERLASVSRLFVAPTARGQGVGASLLGAVSSYAAAEDLQLMLDVAEDGGAGVAFYESLGWEQVDRHPADWVTPDGHRLPVRVYLPPGAAPTGRRASGQPRA